MERSQKGKIPPTHPRDSKHSQGSPPQTGTSCSAPSCPLPLLPRCPGMNPKGASHLHKGNAQGCCSHQQHIAPQPGPNLLHTALKDGRRTGQEQHQILPTHLPWSIGLSLTLDTFHLTPTVPLPPPHPWSPTSQSPNPLHLHPWFLSPLETLPKFPSPLLPHLSLLPTSV